jgi:ribose 1,5-bisphosphate isomerase
MGPELEKRIARLAADRESGASEILAEAIAILRKALEDGSDVDAVADGLCRAHPAMAPVWNAAAAARAARGRPDDFSRFAERVKRAPTAIARFAVECFVLDAGRAGPLRIATISYSATVLRVLEAVARSRAVEVRCSEGRPALEGRKLAARLAAVGIPVIFFTDAALGHAVEESDAVLVGADAVAGSFFLNKSGTGLLAGAAALRGVPVHVAAGRDKFVAEATADRLENRDGPGAEVWPDAPPGVRVRNPYFERVAIDLVTSFITDIGLLPAAEVAHVCEAQARVHGSG